MMMSDGDDDEKGRRRADGRFIGMVIWGWYANDDDDVVSSSLHRVVVSLRIVSRHVESAETINFLLKQIL
jgi:hypothetical protein